MMQKEHPVIDLNDPDAYNHALATAWLGLHDDDPRPLVNGTRYRHSWAAKCSRALSYAITQTPESDPLTINSRWTFRLGQLVHDDWQAALTEAFPEAHIEVEGVNPTVDGGFHADGVIYLADDQALVVELKSINGFGFKRMIGTRSKPEGPRWSAVVQTALNAHATPNCVGALLTYISLENVSVNEAAKNNLSPIDRFMHTYRYSMADLNVIAKQEQLRVRKVLALVDDDMLGPRQIPDPEIPDDAVITDPASGRWEVLDSGGGTLDVGKTWHCDYCNQRSRCIEDGPSPA